MKAKRHKERCVNTSLSRKYTAAEGAHLHRQRAAIFWREKQRKSEREKGGAKIGDRERERRLLQPSSRCATVKVVTKSLASGVLELCASGLTQISDNRAGTENFSPGGGWFMKIPWRNSLNFMDIFILN